MNISWGGNYDDKFYFGGAVGIQTLSFTRKRSYTESEFLIGDFVDPLLTSFRLDDRIFAQGSGLNTSFGMILRPVEFLTLGVTYQSPTYLTINEESDFTLVTNWGNFSYQDLNFDGTIYDLREIDRYLSAITETKYKIRTPSRVNLGGTIFIGKSGFISGDVEMVDYANAELQSNDFSPLGDNQVIVDNFKSVINYRVGGEYRMDEIRFRGGYSHNPDPTGQGNGQDFITAGVGYQNADFFIDAALITSGFNESYAPYSFGNADLEVNSSVQNTTFTLTTGFKF